MHLLLLLHLHLLIQVEGRFYVNAPLEKLMLEELRNACRPGQVGWPGSRTWILGSINQIL